MNKDFNNLKIGKFPIETVKHLFFTFLSFISIVQVALVIIIITPFVYFYTVTFDKKKKLYLFLTRIFVYAFFYMSFINLKKKVDFNNITKPSAGTKRIYVLTHASIIDGLLLFLMPGHIKFMANDFYSKIPIFGLGMAATDNISVKRNEQGAQLDIYYHAGEIIDSGYPLVIFPEGTRTRNGEIGRFQNSAFMLAVEKKAEIVPVVFDTWNFIRPEKFIVRSRDFKVKFLDIIRYDEYKNMSYKELSNFIKDKLVCALAEMRSN